MDFIKYRKIFYYFSAITIGLSILSIVFFGFRTGIDFAGGSLWEISFESEIPTRENLTSFFQRYNLEIQSQQTETNVFIIRFLTITEEKRHQMFTALQEIYPNLEERRFESIGPIIGRELQDRAIWAIILVLLSILLYLYWSFRKFSYKISSWKYGSCAILALMHDALIVAGVFSFLGWFRGWEINADFLVAILVVIGYSVNDTIVTFSKIRENLHSQTNTELSLLINQSINQTLRRSIYTSLTTSIPLVALYFLGPLVIRPLIIAMGIGIIAGVYSSIFLAAPMLFDWQNSLQKIIIKKKSS